MCDDETLSREANTIRVDASDCLHVVLRMSGGRPRPRCALAGMGECAEDHSSGRSSDEPNHEIGDHRGILLLPAFSGNQHDPAMNGARNRPASLAGLAGLAGRPVRPLPAGTIDDRPFISISRQASARCQPT